MNPENLLLISRVFQDPDPKTVSKRLSELDREQRKHLSESIFDIQKRVYNTILEPSIGETYRKIHSNMMRMFFTQIYHINQNLRSDREKWQLELKKLRQIDLFYETSDFDLLNVAENIQQIELKAGVPFLTQYEEVTGVYLLKDPANVFEFNSQVPVIARSGIFGDAACATGEPESSMTVKPVSDCEALFIPREKFVRLIRSVPGLQEKVFQTVVERAKQGSIRAEEHRKLTLEILDNIGQGSFSINVAGEIGENYTSIAAEYLGTETLAGVPFADLAFRDDRVKLRNYYRALHMLFSGTEFNHTVVLDLLPKEVHIKNRDFKLHYSFVQDGAGHVMSVFIRMEDITLKRELARKEEAEKAVTGKMQSNVGGFMDMLEDVENSLRKTKDFGSKYWTERNQPESEVLNEMLRTLHGSKGLSGQFELNRLKSVIHQFEDVFLNFEKEGIENIAIDFEELLSEFNREFEFAASFKENLGQGIIKILNGVSFEQSEFKSMEQMALDGDLEGLRSLIFSRNKTPVTRIISNWKNDSLRLAQKLGKKVEIEFDIDESLMISKSLAKSLNVNLGHLYRNCIDHGIELPEERESAGKNAEGRIDIQIEKSRELLKIRIADDGRGVDDQKISQIAIENPNLDQKKVSEIIDSKAYWKLLFLPGFSSAGKVTDVSGRGVGMDAVMQTISSLSGDIELQSENGKGTEIVITIPFGKS